MERLRIALVTPRIHGIGGIVQHIRKLGEWLEKRGHTVDIVTSPYIPLRGLANLTAAALLAVKLGLASRASVKTYDLVHIHHVMMYYAARASNRPIVLTLHGDVSLQYRMLHRSLSTFTNVVSSRAIRNSELVTTVSPIVAYKYSSMFGINIKYIPNALDLRDIPRGQIEKKEDIVVFVGRLSFEKGIDILLKAASLLEDRKLGLKIIIVGDGPLRNKVTLYTQALSNLRYVGYRPRDEVLHLICRAGMLVAPSRAEGFPTVLLEAFACRTPVIASKIPEIRALFNRGEVYLVDPEPSKVADAIEALYNDDTMKRHLAERSYNVLLSEYTWDKVVDRYIDSYLEVIRSSQPLNKPHGKHHVFK